MGDKELGDYRNLSLFNGVFIFSIASGLNVYKLLFCRVSMRENLNIQVILMLYLILDIQSTRHTDECCRLNAWVNVSDHNEAKAIVSEELSLQGWAITNVLESQSTEASDYFPPCKSYDAFKEASSGLFALRFV